MPMSSVLDLDAENALLKIFGRPSRLADSSPYTKPWVEKDFQAEFEGYLQLCETPKVETLGELIDFNKAHADNCHQVCY